MRGVKPFIHFRRHQVPRGRTARLMVLGKSFRVGRMSNEFGWSELRAVPSFHPSKAQKLSLQGNNTRAKKKQERERKMTRFSEIVGMFARSLVINFLLERAFSLCRHLPYPAPSGPSIALSDIKRGYPFRGVLFVCLTRHAHFTRSRTLVSL